MKDPQEFHASALFMIPESRRFTHSFPDMFRNLRSNIHSVHRNAGNTIFFRVSDTFSAGRVRPIILTPGNTKFPVFPISQTPGQVCSDILNPGNTRFPVFPISWTAEKVYSIIINPGNTGFPVFPISWIAEKIYFIIIKYGNTVFPVFPNNWTGEKYILTFYSLETRYSRVSNIFPPMDARMYGCMQ